MAFKKLPETLVENLTLAGFEDFLPAQEELFRKIREGKNLIILNEGQKGFSTLMIMASIFKVPVPQEGSPRVIMICANDNEVIARAEEMRVWAKHMDLTIDLAHDKGHQVQQRNNIFDGTEIVIGTANRIYNIYIQSGLNLNMLKMFVIDDVNLSLKGQNLAHLTRIGDSLPKCQVIIGAKEYDKKLETLCEHMPIGFVKMKM
ncbi:DEAD/DEAH box helicase family protein [Crocinitomicaceae bacterium]|jgi:ATP-dependent RNA helicase RhlE|nr:DEAD/DEAH box helicase family protein [Crocinitomicaceae bacterium]MDG1347128.1 DEAD/DEAH box helicase family protein [Crocinitomicaceae bacterium]MDG2464270.1 DEAD/DEAH box helicase family protein [Crocinitomicaceae bacterium]